MLALDLERINNTLHSIYHCWKFHTADGCPTHLMGLLERELPQIDLQSWPERFEFGGIYVNGIAVTKDCPLTAPCKIEFYEPRDGMEAFKRGVAVFDPEKHVIYEDSDVLVVFKPAKLPTMPAKEQRLFSLQQSVERYLGHRVHIPSRLDLSTSGLVCISKAARMHAPLQQAFEQRAVKKSYLAQVSGTPEWTQTIVDAPIADDPRHPVIRRVDFESGKHAVTGLAVRMQGQGHSLIEASPSTGRTHQIRVHLASVGFPIVGDNFYSGEKAPELRLLSERVGLYHPFLRQDILIDLPPNLRPAWAYF